MILMGFAIIKRLYMNSKKQPRVFSRDPQKKRKFERDKAMSFNEADDRINDIFCNHGFEDFPHKERQMLTSFYFLLMEDQKNHSSTRLLTLREVAIKHFIDCLMVQRLTELTFPMMDVGTGPGFPGIPLKILNPAGHIYLAEGVQKRVEFLKIAREKLDLQKLDIIGRKIDHDVHYPMQSIITRAFADTSDTLHQVFNCIKPGGKVYLMKGPNVDDELKLAVKKFDKEYKLLKDISYELPKTPHQRRLVIFERRS